MRRVFTLGTIFLIAVFGWTVLARAQEPAVPGPEHEELMAMVGTWDATVKSVDGSESKGVAEYRSACNGLWLESEFKGEFGGQTFVGRGFDSYDAGRKLYTATWVDSMSASPLVLTGTKDKSGKVLTMTGEMATTNGAMKFRTVTKTESKDKFSFTMFLDVGGTETEMMTITYVRRK